MSQVITLQEAETNLKRVKDHHEAQQSKIRQEIAKREEAGLQYADLESKLKEAETIAGNAIALSQDVYDKAKEKAQAEQQAQAKAESDAAAKAETKTKNEARRKYIAGGGNPADFETAWKNGLRDKVLEQAVLSDGKQSREPIVKGL